MEGRGCQRRRTTSRVSGASMGWGHRARRLQGLEVPCRGRSFRRSISWRRQQQQQEPGPWPHLPLRGPGVGRAWRVGWAAAAAGAQWAEK